MPPGKSVRLNFRSSERSGTSNCLPGRSTQGRICKASHLIRVPAQSSTSGAEPGGNAMIKGLMIIYENLFRNITSQLAATAFTLSVLCIAVVWILYASSISIGGEGSLIFQLSQLGAVPAAIFIAMFFIMFFVIWFILYIQYMREAEDIYSHLRERLQGSWTAYYDYTIAGKYIFPARPRANFRFKINQSKKLEMEFDPADNVLFSDVDQNVSQISLRHIEANKYSLMYFYSNK